MKHEHKFQRLRDDALFCECGEIRHVPPFAPPLVPTIWPTPVPWAPDRPWPNTTIPWIAPPNTTITYPVPPLVQPTTVVEYPNDGRMMVLG